MELNLFYKYLGEIVSFCQIVEHDIKLIYAGMLKGDFDDNYQMVVVKKMTLGITLTKLKDLDFSDEKNYISASDYNYLKQITEKRNYYCHSCVLEFVYQDNFLYSKEYQKVCDKVRHDHDRLANLQKNLEQVRLQCLRDYGRI